MYGSIASLRKIRLAAGLSFSALAVLCSASVASALPTIQSLRGANQETSYGAAFPAPLVVWVSDSETSRPVSGLEVHFNPGTGIGLSSSQAITDEYGLASVTAKGMAVCTSHVRAEISGVPEANVIFADLVVDKATLTVVPDDVVVKLGSPLPTLVSYTIRGFVNGDTMETAQITGAPVLTTTAKDKSPHANYAIKGGVGTLSAPNYTFASGFGAVAVLDGPNPSSVADAPEGYYLPPAQPDEAHVQSAITDTPTLIGVLEPSFLAGLRGESGAFVRAAIWQNPVTASSAVGTYLIQAAIDSQALASVAAMPTFAAGVQQNAEIVVRAADLPSHEVATTGAMQLSQARAAIPAAVTTSPSSSALSGRMAVSPILSTVFTSSPNAYQQPTIRKAINQPVYR